MPTTRARRLPPGCRQPPPPEGRAFAPSSWSQRQLNVRRTTTERDGLRREPRVIVDDRTTQGPSCPCACRRHPDPAGDYEICVVREALHDVRVVVIVVIEAPVEGGELERDACGVSTAAERIAGARRGPETRLGQHDVHGRPVGG